MDYEIEDSYSVNLSITDFERIVLIPVNIEITDVNDPPVFAVDSLTYTIPENTPIGHIFGSEVTLTDQDDTRESLAITLTGSNSSGFSIADGIVGKFEVQQSFDYETQSVFNVTIRVEDSSGATDTLPVEIRIIDIDESTDNNAPVFTAGPSATREIAENTDTNTDIGQVFSAIDPDGDTLSYSLGGTDAASFSIVTTTEQTAQLKTKSALDHETKDTYSVEVIASDGELSTSIQVSITVTNVNEPPVFAVESVTYSIPENITAGKIVGTPILATDQDGDTVQYFQSGSVEEWNGFSLNMNTGQLLTRISSYDSETKPTYTLTITARDRHSATDTLVVTINITEAVNRAPTAVGSIPAQTMQSDDSPLLLTVSSYFTDPDNDNLTYTASSSNSGVATASASGAQVSISAVAVGTATITVTASDGSLSVTQTISVTVESATVEMEYPLSGRTQQVQDAIVAAVDGIESASDITETHLAAITELDLNDTGISSLQSGDFEGLTALTRLFLAENSISDISPLSGLTTLTHFSLEDNSISDISVISGLTSLTWLSLSGNSISNISPLSGLTALTSLFLSGNSISNISAVSGLTKLTELWLGGNSIIDISAVSGLTKLTWLSLSGNPILHYAPLRTLVAAIEDAGGSLELDITIPMFVPVSERTQQVQDAIVAAVDGIDSAADITETHLAAITVLDLNDTGISTLQSGDFEGLTALTELFLSGNSISDISALSGLSSLTGLSLNGNSISDISALSGLSSLRGLFLNGNSISDISALSGLTALTALFLSGNSISDISALSGLTALAELSLSGNPISDYAPLRTLVAAIEDAGGSLELDITIPMFVPVSERTQQVRAAIVAAVDGIDSAADVTATHLAAITELDLSNESISSLKSGDFGGLTALTRLNLGNNSISDISALSGLTKLTWLSLGGNSISDISPLSGLTKLTWLSLSGNSISDISSVSGLTALTELFLGGNSISNISALSGLTTLTELELDGNSISNISPLSGLTALTELDLGGNSISNISPLSGLTALTSLNLRSNSISNISPLSGLTALRELRLIGNPPFSDYAPLRTLIAAIEADNRTLSLDITIPAAPPVPVSERTQQVQDAIVAAVPGIDSASDITEIHLAVITDLDISNESISSLKSGDFGGLDALTGLNLIGNSISDISPLSGLTKLTVLNLGGNSISDISPLSGLTNLTGLGLQNNSISNISPLSGLTKLTQLYLDGNSISDVSPLESLTSLSTLRLRGNSISDYDPLRTLVAAIEADFRTLTLDITIPTAPPLSGRTQQVQDAIVAAVDGIDSADDVTETHLAAITELDLNFKSISSLKSGDFEDLTALTSLDLAENSISNISALSGLTTLTKLFLGNNSISNISAVSGLTKLTELDLYDNSISNISSVSGLTKLTKLYLDGNSISDISAVSGLTVLKELYLDGNSISDVSPLEGLTSLRTLRLSGNSISDYAPLGRLVAAIKAAGGSLDLDITILLSVPVSERTQQVRDAIVAAVDGIEAAADVTVTHLAAITELNINDTGISSLKSGDFEGLTALTSLDLADNSISDISSISGLTTLTTLDLYENSISDISAVSGMTKLTRLDLGDNSIIDISAVSGLTSLTELDLYENSIINISSISGLTKLTTLSLDENSISDISPLSGLTKLTHLWLSGNSISNYVPLRTLVAAIVADNRTLTLDITIPIFVPVSERTQQVQDAIVAAVDGIESAADVTETHLAAITELDLFNKSISSLKSGDFNNLTVLTTLDLDDNSISDISSVSGLTALTHLFLNVNSISDISALSGLTTLIELGLQGNSISDISSVSGLTKLTHLSLGNNYSLSNISSVSGLTKLTHLSMFGNSISDISSVSGLTALTELDLNQNSISDISALSGLTKLTGLNLYENSISNVSPLEGLTSLEYLFLSDNPISDYAPLRRLVAAIEADDGTLELDIIIPTGAPSIINPPIQTSLLPNYPNPFNPETWIPYQLAKPSDVTLTIYNVRGVVVRELVLGHRAAGVYYNRTRAAHWDGKNNLGEKVAGGVYFVKFKAGNYTKIRKMLIRK